jgi:hypothetical protein
MAGNPNTDPDAADMHADSGACASHIGARAHGADIGACADILGIRRRCREQRQDKYRSYNRSHGAFLESMRRNIRRS